MKSGSFNLESKIKDIVYNRINDAVYDALDNIAIVLSAKFPDYDVDWAADEMTENTDRIDTYIDRIATAVVRDLFYRI